MLQPKVGDSVEFEGIITEINHNDIYIRYADNHFDAIDKSFIKKILPRPPKVGDIVYWDGDRHYPANTYGMTLIHIHKASDDNRKFAVAAFKGDIPRSVPFEIIRLVP